MQTLYVALEYALAFVGGVWRLDGDLQSRDEEQTVLAVELEGLICDRNCLVGYLDGIISCLHRAVGHLPEGISFRDRSILCLLHHGSFLGCG